MIRDSKCCTLGFKQGGPSRPGGTDKQMKISVIWFAFLVAASGLLAAGGQQSAQPATGEEKAGPPSPLAVAPRSQQGLQTPSDPANLAASPASSSVTVGSAPVDQKSYIIGAEDVLGIQVWQVREMTGQYLVPSGWQDLRPVGRRDTGGWENP